MKRWWAVAAVSGGLLWIVHGAFEMLEPWGAATEYRPELGYGVVQDPYLFVIYGLPGPPALFLTAVLMADLSVKHWLIGVAGRWSYVIAAALAGAALTGVALRFEPPFVAGMTIGRLVLSVAAILTARVLLQRAHSRAAGALLIAGVLGLVVMVARVLVNAFDVLPPPAAFAVAACFGCAWIGFGALLSGKGAEAVSGQ